jgi:hypothetical protein
VTLEELAVLAVRNDLAIVHVVGERSPGPDASASALPPGRTVLVFTVVLGEGGWLAVAATNTPIAALPTTGPARP